MTLAPRLYVRTEAIEDPGELTGALTGDPGAVCWIRDGDGMVGVGEVVRHKATDPADAEAWWTELCRSVVDLSDAAGQARAAEVFGAGLVGFGSFCFDPGNSAGQSVMIVPQQVVGRRGGRAWRTTVSETRAGLHHPPEPRTSRPPSPPGAMRIDDQRAGDPVWERAVASAVDRIQHGPLEKVVLARDLRAIAERPIEPRWLVERLAAGYPRCWTYHVDGLVGATPELLVRRQDGLATSRVLAGTIRRLSGADEQDHALAAALAGSSKDVEEHEYAVSSVAAALAPFCSGMNVPDAPYVLELPNVLHLATDVTAVARPDAGALSLAAALHPSAAVCGTPTALARETIAELEGMDRDRYAGPVGWVDARGDGEWGIALRCGLIEPDDPRRIRLYAGCGIVAGSDPGAESAEAAAKFVPMRQALGVPDRDTV